MTLSRRRRTPWPCRTNMTLAGSVFCISFPTEISNRWRQKRVHTSRSRSTTRETLVFVFYLFFVFQNKMNKTRIETTNKIIYNSVYSTRGTGSGDERGGVRSVSCAFRKDERTTDVENGKKYNASAGTFLRERVYNVILTTRFIWLADCREFTCPSLSWLFTYHYV